jgi:hypothetical protein
MDLKEKIITAYNKEKFTQKDIDDFLNAFEAQFVLAARRALTGWIHFPLAIPAEWRGEYFRFSGILDDEGRSTIGMWDVEFMDRIEKMLVEHCSEAGLIEGPNDVRVDSVPFRCEDNWIKYRLLVVIDISHAVEPEPVRA